MYIDFMGRSKSHLPRLRWLMLWIAVALPLHGLEELFLAPCEQAGNHCHAQNLFEEPHADHLDDCESDHPQCTVATPASASAHPSPAHSLAKPLATGADPFVAKYHPELVLRTGPPAHHLAAAPSPYRTRVGLILYS